MAYAVGGRTHEIGVRMVLGARGVDVRGSCCCGWACIDGWFAFETPHASPEACVEDTKKNIAFVMKYLS